MLENVLGFFLVIAILGGAAVFTQWFTKRNYLKCGECGILNAMRREACRNCGNPLEHKS